MRFQQTLFLVAAYLGLADLSLTSAAEVSHPDEAELRAAVATNSAVDLHYRGVLFLSAPLSIDKDLILDGAGFQPAISGSNTVRLFNIAHGAKLVLRHLKLTGGSSDRGGAIFNGGELVGDDVV